MAKKGQKTVLDAQKSVEQTASVMERLFRAPKPVLLVLPILALSLIFGVLIDFDQDNLYETFFVNGIMILAVPVFLSALISVPLAESLGGKMYLRRSMLLSFLSLLIIGGVLIIFKILESFFEMGIEISAILIFGYSVIIWLRHLSLLSTSNSSHAHSLPTSLLQPIFGFIMIAIFLPPFGLMEGILAFAFILIFLCSVVFLTVIITSPMKKAFGINGLTMLRYSLDHITEGGVEGAEEIESFFKSFAKKMDVHIGLIAFKLNDKIKSIIVVPSVHPGPFGNLGGSDMPLKLADSLKDRCKAVLVPHGSATHDLNLSSSHEKDKIAKAAVELLDKVNYSNFTSQFIRHKDSLDVCAQIFDDGVLLIHTSSPNPTDDVDYSTGAAIREKAKAISRKDALFVDAHNCAEKGSGCVYFGTKESYKLIDLAESASKKTIENTKSGIKIGYAQKTGYETQKGIGKCGIQVLVAETDGQKAAYILFDGNNMVIGLREKILKAVRDMVDEAEVITTDNHAVNATIGGFNPVGLRMDANSLVKDVKVLVKRAIDDLEEVEVGMTTGLVKNISVFGHENVARLSSTINSTMSILRITTFLSLIFAFVASAMLFLFLY